MPQGIERWTRANAAVALVAAAVSVALSDLRPALGAALVSVAWCFLRYAPSRDLRHNLANLVTAARLGALAVVLAAIPRSYELVAWSAGLVYVFDGVDGLIARRRDETSTFGAHFDMETDCHVVLLLSAYLVVYRGFGAWVLAFGALRYVYVIARALSPGPDAGRRERRSNLGRIVFTFVSLSLALACVPAWTAFSLPLLAAALAALAISFTPDFVALVRRPDHSTIA